MTSIRQRLIVDVEKCTGCLICQLRCSFHSKKEFDLSSSAIVIERPVGADNEFAISFTSECHNCGVCARFCPYGALTWSKDDTLPE